MIIKLLERSVQCMNKLKPWLIQNTKGVKFMLLASFCIICVISALNVFLSVSLKLVIDIATRKNNTPLLIGLIISISVVVLTALFNGLLSYFRNKSMLKIDKKIKSSMLEQIERIPFIDSQKFHSGDLLTRLTSDIEKTAAIIPNDVLSIISGSLSCLFALIYSFYLSWKMTILALCLSPLVIIWGKILLPKIQKYATNVRIADSNTRAYTQEQLSNISTIKCFSSYNSSIEKFNFLFNHQIKQNLKNVVVTAILENGSFVFGFFSMIISVGFGSYLVLKNELTIGSVIGFIQMQNYIIWPFSGMMTFIGNIQTGKASAKRIIEIMDIQKEEFKNNNTVIDKENKLNQNDVCMYFDNVGFSYNFDKEILKDVNVTLNANQLVVIKGKSGCGKSTFLKIALSLYNPTEGKVYLKYNNTKVKGTDIRNYISYVPQDHVLFSGTIEENILYGKPNATKQEIINASKKANVHNVILELPNGYQTMVEEGGKNLSFGQCQRIAIARALIKDVPILILDEPTASLDQISYELIMETLREEAKTKLCIMVSHSEDSHMNCDRVLIFKDQTIYKNQKLVQFDDTAQSKL